MNETGQTDVKAPDDEGGDLGAWRWVVAILVLMLLAYPIARWLKGGDQPGAGQQTSATLSQDPVQASYQFFQAGQYQQAVDAAKAALTANPNLPDAYNNLAVSYLGLKMYDDATQAAQDAIRLRPDFQLAKNNLAWIQQEKAKATGSPRTSQTPVREADALVNESLEHFNAGRLKECVETASRAIRIDPSSSRAFLNAGICAGVLKQWEQAISYTQEAVRLSPDSQLAKNNLAWMQQEKLKAAETSRQLR